MIEAVRRRGTAKRVLMPLLVGALCWTTPVHAQMSDGFKFLEAVRKREGAKVEQVLSEPGSTLINARDVTNGQTALHIVTARRDTTWMTYMLAKGANVNAKDVRGVSPLVLACNLGFIEGVQLLVDRGARIDEPNDAGETPLISAVHRRDTAMMRVLLKAGADPDRSDNSGRNARDYAKLSSNGTALLSEIEANAKPRGGQRQQGGGKTYGPTF